MKHILQPLAGLATLEPLGALETLAKPGLGYDIGGTLVVHANDGRHTLAEQGVNARVLLQAQRAADTLTLHLQVAPQDLPTDLRTALRLLGSSPKGPVALGAPMAIEQYEHRLQELRHAARLLQLLVPLHADAVALAERLFALATVLIATNRALFEAENTYGTSPSRLKTLQQQADHALAQVKAAEADLRPALTFRLDHSCFAASLLVQANPSQQSMHVCEAHLGWPVPETLAAGQRRPVRNTRWAEADSASTVVSPPGSTAVDTDVLAALHTATAQGNELFLSAQLDKRTYGRVKALLKALGGSWKRAQQSHVFDRPAQAVLTDILSGRIVTDRDWEFFPTPEPLVRRMIGRAAAWLQPGATVGEPSAGQGAIALAAAALVGMSRVDCTEAMPRNAQALRELGFSVHEGDFLQRQPQPLWDAVLMNPPFSNHQDAQHITHALGFLKPGGVLVACASPAWQRAGTSRASAFRNLLDTLGAQVEDIPAGTFRESGTDVATVLITVRLPEHAQAEPPPATTAPLARTTPTAPPQLQLFDA